MDLTPEELDAAWVEARRTSEFMPVSATIRAAHKKMRSRGENTCLGPSLLRYTETVTPEEREEALKFSQKLKEQLGIGKDEPEKAERKKTERRITVVPSLRTIEAQKVELRRRGFLK